ncbi:MAG: hypothetical protein Q9212_005047 [Teloschistes hypoglaucus]
MAALRFRAENSHRIPTTTRGWYFYHKSKHYYVMYAAMTEGLKMGFMFPPVILSLLYFERTVDLLRGRQDFLSTVIGSLSTAGLFSLKNHFNLPTTMHMARLGLVGGLAFGFIQDLHALGRGKRLDYVEYLKGIKGKIRGDAAMG